jgi:hypothetical protein
MSLPVRLAIVSVFLVACHAPQPAQQTANTSTPTDTPAAAKADGCYMVIGACGCAEGCAMGQPSVARWCFDEQGNGSVLQGKGPPGRCFDVIEKPQACGGECIPSTAFFHCHVENSACVP